jgi:hypothetical protein
MGTLTLLEDPQLFLPHSGGQAGFMEDYVSRYCALAGGWYAGKTWVGARKHANVHVHNAFDIADGRPTHVDSLAIAQNYTLATTVMIPELQLAFDEMGLPWRWVADSKKFWFEFPDLGTVARPSRMFVRSAEAPETITSMTVGLIWGDEVARWGTDEDPLRDPLLQAKGRLRDPKADVKQFNMTFTHEGDDTPVYRDFESDPKPDHKLYRAGTFENPHAEEFGRSMRQQLTSDLATQYLDGRAAKLRGNRVYGHYHEERNRLPDDAVLNPAIPLQLSIDFNIDPGMHAVVGQHDERADVLTAHHAIHREGMHVPQMIAEFRRLVDTLGGWQWPVLELFGDASGGNRNASRGETCWDVVEEQLHVHGIPYRKRVPAANPHIADRVNTMNAAMFSAAGRVRYFVHRRCAPLILDFKHMKWDGDELNKKDRKRSHPSDAEGYRAHYLMPIRRLDRTVARPLRTAAVVGGAN